MPRVSIVRKYLVPGSVFPKVFPGLWCKILFSLWLVVGVWETFWHFASLLLLDLLSQSVKVLCLKLAAVRLEIDGPCLPRMFVNALPCHYSGIGDCPVGAPHCWHVCQLSYREASWYKAKNLDLDLNSAVCQSYDHRYCCFKISPIQGNLFEPNLIHWMLIEYLLNMGYNSRHQELKNLAGWWWR